MHSTTYFVTCFLIITSLIKVIQTGFYSPNEKASNEDNSGPTCKITDVNNKEIKLSNKYWTTLPKTAIDIWSHCHLDLLVYTKNKGDLEFERIKSKKGPKKQLLLNTVSEIADGEIGAVKLINCYDLKENIIYPKPLPMAKPQKLREYDSIETFEVDELSSPFYDTTPDIRCVWPWNKSPHPKLLNIYSKEHLLLDLYQSQITFDSREHVKKISKKSEKTLSIKPIMGNGDEVVIRAKMRD